MKSITMTEAQTAIWEDNGSEAKDLMRDLRNQAEAMREEFETVEIYTADGIVADVVQD